MQDRAVCPSTSTVQAPHCPSPQPNLLPGQSEVVAKDREQAVAGFAVNLVRAAVHLQFVSRHNPKSYTRPTRLSPAADSRYIDGRYRLNRKEGCTVSQLPLYVRIMGEDWTQIAAPVRALHATDSTIHARGRFRIERGRGRVANVLARVLRLPRPSEAADIALTVTAEAGGERWLRVFDGRDLETRQSQSGRLELAERFGLFEIRFHLDTRDGSLLYIQRDAALRAGSLRLRIPGAWAPSVTAREDPAGADRIKVTVRVDLPGHRRLIAYDGIIQVQNTRT